MQCLISHRFVRPLSSVNAARYRSSKRLSTLSVRLMRQEALWKPLQPLRVALPRPCQTLIRRFATKANDSTAPSSKVESSNSVEPRHPKWVVLMNDALRRYPLECGIGYIFLDAATIISLYSILTFGFNAIVPVDFALAYGLNRLLRRFRLPLDALVAALLVRAFPHLRLVNVSHSFEAIAAAFSFQSYTGTASSLNSTSPSASSIHSAANPPPTPPLSQSQMASSSSPTSSSAAAATAAAASSLISSLLSGPFAGIKMIGSFATHVLDSYGLALLVAQRCIVSLSSTCLIYALLTYGVDVEAHLEGMGIGTELSGAASKWAASACLAAPLFPVVLLGAARLAPLLAKARLALSAALLRKAVP